MIYLDSAATSLLKPPQVGEAMLHAMRTMASPGRGAHEAAMGANETVFACREAAADLFHFDKPENVVFTMNATHALNLAIHACVKPGMNVLISGFEHNAVTRPLAASGAHIRVFGRRVFDPEDSLRSFRQAVKGSDLVICTHVSNVFGYILPIEEIAILCAKQGVKLIVDASQSAGILPLDLDRLHADFVAMPGHKGLMGPQGTGILFCNGPVRPLLYGGSGSDSMLQRMPEYLPDRLEAGTPNVCGIAGLLAGIQYIQKVGMKQLLAREEELKNRMIAELRGSGLRLFTGDDRSQLGVLSVVCDWMDCEVLATKLAERGICTRAGLHCAPLAHESAGTLRSGTLRFSFSPFLKEEEIRSACAAIREIVT